MEARPPENTFGREAINFIREALVFLHRSHVETLTLFAYVEEAFPVSVLDQLNGEILRSLASIKVLISQANSYRLSAIVRKSLEDERNWNGGEEKSKGLASAAGRLLGFYRTRYPDTPWWSIPPDGFIHDNLLRLSIAAGQDPEADRIARESHWWTLRLQHGAKAISSDLQALKIYIELPHELAGQDPAHYIFENLKTETGILGALWQAAEQFLGRSVARPRIVLVGDLGEFPADHLRGDFDLTRLPSLEGFDNIDAIVSRTPLPAADLRQAMSNNIPVFCLDMLSLSHPANHLPETLLSNLKSTLLPRSVPPPTWAKHAESLIELFQSRDTPTRVRFVEIYDRYPHFRHWAFYAGTDKDASPIERAALYTLFLARVRPEFSDYVIDIALKESSQAGVSRYLYWLALEVQTRILGKSSCRQYIMKRHEIPLPRITLSGLNDQSERLRALVSIFNLAQQYNLIRESLPSGSERTGRMEEVAATMTISKFDLPSSSLQDTLSSKDGGYRLWGYVRSALHGKRGDIEAILAALKLENQNFCMYHGLRYLERLTAELKTIPAGIRKNLVELGERIPNSGDRRMIYDRILRRFTQPAAKRAANKRLLSKRKK